jgi:hypothetical protein
MMATLEYRTKGARGMARRSVGARAMRWRCLFRLRLACAEVERRRRNWERER